MGDRFNNHIPHCLCGAGCMLCAACSTARSDVGENVCISELKCTLHMSLMNPDFCSSSFQGMRSPFLFCYQLP